MTNTWLQSLEGDEILVLFPSQGDGDGTTITLHLAGDTCAPCRYGRILGDLVMHVESPQGEMTTKLSILEGETIYDAVLKAVQIAKNHNVTL